jgi:hypothetical protein
VRSPRPKLAFRLLSKGAWNVSDFLSAERSAPRPRVEVNTQRTDAVMTRVGFRLAIDLRLFVASGLAKPEVSRAPVFPRSKTTQKSGKNPAVLFRLGPQGGTGEGDCDPCDLVRVLAEPGERAAIGTNTCEKTNGSVIYSTQLPVTQLVCAIGKAE